MAVGKQKTKIWPEAMNLVNAGARRPWLENHPQIQPRRRLHRFSGHDSAYTQKAGNSATSGAELVGGLLTTGTSARVNKIYGLRPYNILVY